MPIAWMASAATKRLSWSRTTSLKNTKMAIPAITAKKAFTLGGCFFTHQTALCTGLRILPGPILLVPTRKKLKKGLVPQTTTAKKMPQDPTRRHTKDFQTPTRRLSWKLDAYLGVYQDLSNRSQTLVQSMWRAKQIRGKRGTKKSVQN